MGLGGCQPIPILSERFGNFSYNIPLPNGSCTITLKFAEIYDSWAGARVFDVKIEGKDGISNLDTFRKVGKNQALDISLPVSVTDGVLNLDFQSAGSGAILITRLRKREASLESPRDRSSAVRAASGSEEISEDDKTSPMDQYPLASRAVRILAGMARYIPEVNKGQARSSSDVSGHFQSRNGCGREMGEAVVGIKTGDMPGGFWTQMVFDPSGNGLEFFRRIIEAGDHIGDDLHMHSPFFLGPLCRLEQGSEIIEVGHSLVGFLRHSLEVHSEGVEVRTDLIETLQGDETIRYEVRQKPTRPGQTGPLQSVFQPYRRFIIGERNPEAFSPKGPIHQFLRTQKP